MNTVRSCAIALAVALASLSLTACEVDVKDGGKGKDKNVDIRTPIGDISVRSGEDGPDTGLPVYPGAQKMLNDDDHESADVSIGNSFFAVRVAAARYQSGDAPQAIVDFYKDKLSTYGAVLECKGDVDFSGGSKEPVCKEDAGSEETQLVTGTEDSHRIVAVKPRGSGSEFAVVSVRIDDKS